MLNQRRKLLGYLRRSNFPRYAFVLHKLGLKDTYAKQVSAAGCVDCSGFKALAYQKAQASSRQTLKCHMLPLQYAALGVAALQTEHAYRPIASIHATSNLCNIPAASLTATVHWLGVVCVVYRSGTISIESARG
eukprot:GHUV01043865.1.p2 GENE.GHUV01043865.1~~GHUV01043865.1.p2  ORF type:complete len:134 (-),score=19.38 GHUV01043865.1:223-624(-)